MCLLSRCLATGVSYSFKIPAFRDHVKLLYPSLKMFSNLRISNVGITDAVMHEVSR
jgi:hypothetical protein